MQPRSVHVPPRRLSFSTSATFSPNCAPRIAATYPPGPDPITVTSNCSVDKSVSPQKAVNRQPSTVTRQARAFSCHGLRFTVHVSAGKFFSKGIIDAGGRLLQRGRRQRK